jgi:hypothetical protein
MELNPGTHHNRHPPSAELQQKAKDDPALARLLGVTEDVTQRYSDTFRQLADC